MKRILLLVCIFIFTPFVSFAYTADDFVITVDTTLPGSASDTFQLPTTGDGYDAVVDWGDGATTTLAGTPGLVSHTYATSGVKTIVITPNTPSGFPQIYFNGQNDDQKILTVEQWGTTQWRSMANAFSGCTNLTVTASDVPNLSNVTDISGMFMGANSFNQPVNNWNVSNVTNMNGVFWSANSFNQSLSNWDVSNVTSMSYMFSTAQAFNQSLSNWDVSNVTDMSGMFQDATSFNQPLNNWNVSSVTDTNEMFDSANSFNQSLSNWDVSNVTDMSGMFQRANSFNQNISTWDVSSVTSMSFMFSEATAFNQPLNSWNVAAVTDMWQMFSGASSFNQNISNWDVSNVTSMNSMFADATDFNSPLNSWNVSSVTNMERMFNAAVSFNQPLDSWNVSNVINMSFMFNDAIAFNQDISNWDISNVTNFNNILSEAISFNIENYSSLLSDWSLLTVSSGENLGTIGDLSNPVPYCDTVQAARDILTGAPNNWTITDGGATTTCASVTTYTLSYAAGLNAVLIGSGTQVVTEGGSGSEVRVAPHEGYVFVRWSDGSTSNPRTDTNILGNLSVEAVVELQSSSGGGGGGGGTRTTRGGASAEAAVPASDEVSLGAIIESVELIVEKMKADKDELQNLPDGEKKSLILLLQMLVLQLLALLAAM